MGYVGTHAQALGVSQRVHVLDHNGSTSCWLIPPALATSGRAAQCSTLGGGEGKCAEVKPESPSCLLSSAERDMRSLL